MTLKHYILSVTCSFQNIAKLRRYLYFIATVFLCYIVYWHGQWIVYGFPKERIPKTSKVFKTLLQEKIARLQEKIEDLPMYTVLPLSCNSFLSMFLTSYFCFFIPALWSAMSTEVDLVLKSLTKLLSSLHAKVSLQQTQSHLALVSSFKVIEAISKKKRDFYSNWLVHVS